MKKKILFTIIGVLCIVIGMCVISAQAATYTGSCGYSVTYSLDTKTDVLTISGTGAMADYTSPSSVPWYSNSSYIKSVVIEDSVTSIGDYALYNCYSLTSVTIGNGVTDIGYGAFSWCENLTSVTIGGSVTSIGDYAFAHCYGLTSIDIPDGVTSIGNYAFYDCYRLTSVTIGNGVTDIGDYAFSVCYSLTSITVEKENGYYCSVDGNLFNKDKTELIQYAIGKTDKTYIIPDSVTSIGNYAFYSCDSLTSIEIPDSVTSIGDSAFYGCTGLTSVIIPNSVTSIGDYAFRNCTGLTSVTIGNSVTSIGYSAFYYCSGLTSVTIGNGVTSIGAEAFSSCYGLTEVNWNAKSVADFSDYNYVFYKAGRDGEGIRVIFGDSVEKIPAYCFYPDSDSSYSPKITSVVIGDSVTSIGDSAFEDCTGLTSITIGNSVTSIGDDAFRGCSSLTSITVEKENGYYCSVDGNLFNKDKTELIQYAVGKTDTTYIIPDSVTSIGYYAFEGCISLTSITIGNGVTDIGYSAFYGCTGLTTIIIGGSVTSIGTRAFEGCTGLTSITIPDSVTDIGYGAFSWCENLTSVTIGGSVTSIGDYAFYYCRGLTSVTIPDSVTSIGDWAFSSCGGLTDVYYSGSEEEWKNISIRSGNTSLTNATIHYNYVSEEGTTYVKISARVEDNTVTITGENVKEENRAFAITIVNGVINATKIDLTDGEETIEISESAQQVKIFVWESIESMMPLCEAVVITK